MKLASTLEINTPRFDDDLDTSHDAHAQSSPASQAAGRNEDILTSQEQVQLQQSIANIYICIYIYVFPKQLQLQ